MAVAEFMPEVPVPDGLTVCFLDPVEARDRAEHRKMARYRIMQSCEESIDSMDAVSGVNVEAGCSRDGAKAVWCPGGSKGREAGGSDGVEAPAWAVVGVAGGGVCSGAPEDLGVVAVGLS